MRPGITVCPDPSIRRAPSGISTSPSAPHAPDAAVRDDHGPAALGSCPGAVHDLDPGDRDDRFAVLHELPGVFGEFAGGLGGGRRRKREEHDGPEDPEGLPGRGTVREEFGHLRLLAGAGTGERYPESGRPCENHRFRCAP